MALKRPHTHSVIGHYLNNGSTFLHIFLCSLKSYPTGIDLSQYLQYLYLLVFFMIYCFLYPKYNPHNRIKTIYSHFLTY